MLGVCGVRHFHFIRIRSNPRGFRPNLVSYDDCVCRVSVLGLRIDLRLELGALCLELRFLVLHHLVLFPSAGFRFLVDYSSFGLLCR